MPNESQQSPGVGASGPGASSQPVPTTARKAGRELALAVMCALESYAQHDTQGRRRAMTLTLDSPPRGEQDGESAFSDLARSQSSRAFAEELLALWTPRTAEVDAVIERVSKRWRVSRMDQVDRNVVRLAAAELSARAETPRAVVLAEAVRLAGRYGSERSPRFVNGLVESVALALRGPASTAASPRDGRAAESKKSNASDGAPGPGTTEDDGG